MKKILYTIIIACSVYSCNYLDFDETSGMYTREDMYKYFNKASQMLVNAYRYMPQDFGEISKAMRDCGIDDAEFGDANGAVQGFNNGNWSSLATLDTKWNLYNGIRCTNEFLESIATVDYSKYKDDPAYKNWMKKMELYPYEARVLRAHYFFELARRYGDIAIPTKMLSIEQANSINKTPFSQIIDFIVSECNDCMKKLPLDHKSMPDSEIGRMTKGFAMAVKSKALLYAASKLHNPTMEKAKWVASAEAAMEIISLNYYKMDADGTTNDIESPEVVMIRMNNFSSDFELYNFPFRFTEGKRTYSCGTYPTQNLVDAFQTINGYDIILTENGWQTDDRNFDVSRPYVGRDPRFARTILAHGMDFKGTTIEAHVGGKDYSPSRDKGTPTGYFLRKYITETTSFTPDAEVKNKHHWVVYRYAETLLTYAESMVEAFNDPTYKDDEKLPLSALDAINKVRLNARMPLITTTDPAEFIDALRREWRVEFAFEDHRFWDIRRWSIGSQIPAEIAGVSITRANNKYSYRRFVCERRVWNDRMNIYPIPKSELFNNPNLNPQNIGW